MARPYNDEDPHRDAGFDATRFDGRVAIVTGGGSRADGIGNGRASAILLARRGARVLVLDTDLAASQATVDHIAREGGNMSRVAEKSGLERTHLYRKLKQLGIALPRRTD